MNNLHPMKLTGAERRRFERVDVPGPADVYISDRKGKRLGLVVQLGRGGFAMEPEQSFKRDKHLKLVLVCDREFIRRPIEAVVRYTDANRVGLEFENLDADTAVEIGILIGKFYASESVNA